MIVAGFGDTVASMYTFPLSMMDDGHSTARPPAVKPVPLTSGVLDVHGSAINPRAAQIIDKAFIIAHGAEPVYLTAIDVNTSIFTHIQTLAHTPIKPGSVIIHDSIGVGADDGIGSLVDSLAQFRGTIDYETGDCLIFEDFFNDILTLEYQYPAGYDSDPWETVGTALDALRAATIAIGRSKLWAQMRDGSYRWTWAKCTRLRANEKVGQIHHCPVRMVFRTDDSVWYSETPHTLLTDGDDILNNAGNTATQMTVTVTAGGGAAMTAVDIEHITSLYFKTAWSGSVAAGKSLVIDSLKRSVKNDGAAAYVGLTLTYPNNPWFGLLPGNNQVRVVSLAGAGASVTYAWHDAWVL